MNKMTIQHIKCQLILLLITMILVSCGEQVPTDFVDAKDSLRVYPDYRGVVVPKNIAPLNFQVRNEGEAYAVIVKSDKKEVIELANATGKIQFDKEEWNELLQEASSLSVEVFVRQEKSWRRYTEFDISVVSDSIDKFVTFRLIEPSYENSSDIAIFQQDVEEGKMEKIVGNRYYVSNPGYRGAVCMNCHVAQLGNGENTSFQYRCNGGGMIVTYNGESKVVATKVGDMPSGAVYEKWHPTLPLIAFSNNTVRQLFPSNGIAKIEVLDFRSDLLLYDVEKNTIRYVLKGDDASETYPVWSPDGKYLYYCSTDTPYVVGVAHQYEKQKYDLMRIAFENDTFGVPEMVYNASAHNHSVAKPRISPDGRYVAMTVSKYGAYHYMHRSSDIALFDLQEQKFRLLDEVNSPSADGYVTWSSNGRWLMIGSRRDDDDHARLFFSYFDENGVAHKPFAMPHEDPLFDAYLLKSYNCPEFNTKQVLFSEGDIYKLIAREAVVTPDTIGDFGEKSEADGVSGASIVDYRK